MTTVTTKKLGTTVGAEVLGIDRTRLRRTTTLPAACMEALEENGVLVFRELHIDDETQVAFSKRLDDVGKAEPAPPPSIFTVSLDPAKSPTAEYLRGTFNWHIDGAQDDVPTKATTLSAACSRATGARPSSPARTPPTTTSARTRRSGSSGARAAFLRGLAAPGATRTRHPRSWPAWREKPDKEHPLVWRHRSGRRSLVIGVTASHVVGMDLDEGTALLADLLARATAPDRVYRHEWTVGDLVIWDNTGVMHRVQPYDPSSPREMHRTTMSGDEPIQ